VLDQGQQKEQRELASDELKMVLREINEKFDTVIEAFNMVKETLDRHKEGNQREHDELKNEIMLLRKDLNDHRDNTELHAGSRKKKA
jgi:hypothetical protein